MIIESEPAFVDWVSLEIVAISEDYRMSCIKYGAEVCYVRRVEFC
jgi:hypothetical protein